MFENNFSSAGLDDLLIISHKPCKVMNSISDFYTIKPGSEKPPEIHLGADIGKIQTPDGREIWSLSSKTYIKNAVKIVEALFDEDGEGYHMLKNNAKNSLPVNYKPELDVTQELGPELLARYLQLIGICCRWAIELGRIDIFHEVSILSQHQVNPCEGHLEALYHVFAYLKKHPDMGRLGFDPNQLIIDESAFTSNAD